MSFYICRACDTTHDHPKKPPCSSPDCWSCESNHPWRHPYQPLIQQQEQQEEENEEKPTVVVPQSGGSKGVHMLRVPPRGSYPEFWINPAHIVSIYSIGNTVYIDLKRTTPFFVYDSEEDAMIAARALVEMVESPGTIIDLPKATGGSIRMH